MQVGAICTSCQRCALYSTYEYEKRLRRTTRNAVCYAFISSVEAKLPRQQKPPPLSILIDIGHQS